MWWEKKYISKLSSLWSPKLFSIYLILYPVLDIFSVSFFMFFLSLFKIDTERSWWHVTKDAKAWQKLGILLQKFGKQWNHFIQVILFLFTQWRHICVCASLWKNEGSMVVVYFNQCLGAAHSKRWLKSYFSKFFVLESLKNAKELEICFKI